MTTHDTRRVRGDTLSEFWDVEAHDPEGHGPNIAFRPTAVTAFLAGAGIIAVGATLLAWNRYGGHSALLMLGIVGGVAILVALPVGSIVLMRSRAHAAMEQEAIELHASAAAAEDRRDTVRLAVNARGSDPRAVEGVEYTAPDSERSDPADTDAIQRLEDEGGPVVENAPHQDKPLRVASMVSSSRQS